jgi:hypothetical protein
LICTAIVTVEVTKLVSHVITALHPADIDHLVYKTVFSMCTQIKNHGHIKPNTAMAKLHRNGNSDT